MKFVCLGYLDESKFNNMPADQAQRMMEACMAYDDVLRAGGHFLGGEALDSATKAVTLRAHGDRIEATDGPYAETKEILGGILLLEARDMQHAVELMSKHPGVKFGPFEIRPADETINKIVADHAAKFAKRN